MFVLPRLFVSHPILCCTKPEDCFSENCAISSFVFHGHFIVVVIYGMTQIIKIKCNV